MPIHYILGPSTPSESVQTLFFDEAMSTKPGPEIRLSLLCSTILFHVHIPSQHNTRPIPSQMTHLHPLLGQCAPAARIKRWHQRQFQVAQKMGTVVHLTQLSFVPRLSLQVTCEENLGTRV